MALARFFDKAALSAATFLRGFDRSLFEEKLKSVNVGVVFEADPEADSEKLIAVEMLVNVLARLYSTLSLVSGSDKVLEAMRSLARRINPLIEIRADCRDATIIVATAKHPALKSVKGECPVIYVGADGWVAKVSNTGALNWGRSANSLGAAAAGAIAAANVFRHVFRDQLPDSELDGKLALNLLDYSTKSDNKRKPDLPSVDLTGTSLIGAGAIGNAAIWMLSKLPCVGGTLEVIDHESIDLGNLQRYLLTNDGSIGLAKVRLAESTPKVGPFTIKAIPKEWAGHTEDTDWRFTRLAVAVDTVRERINIAGSLPKELLNAWTQTDEVGISRHYEFGKSACLCCLYYPERHAPSESEVVSLAVGLPKDDMSVRDLLQTGRPVDRPFLNRVAIALGINPNGLSAYEGANLRHFYSEAICGGIVLRLGAAAHSGTEVPMAFQSALAGIFLAAEILISAGKIDRVPLPSSTRVRILKPLNGTLHVPVGRAERCICRDPDYIAAYGAKYDAT